MLRVMVREGGSEDFGSATDLLNRVWPYRVGSERGLRHAAASAPPNAHRRYWAADDAGKLVGWATAGIEYQSSERPGFLQASVALESRNAGIGTALLERSEGFEAAASKAGIEGVTFHSMRHAFASRMIDRSISSTVLAALMGHESSTITERRYIHLFDRQRTDETVRQAMAL